jgi:phosphoribosyl 1,2-cyclic phosphodiesterase
MIKCVSLASGSKGNSFLIQFNHDSYLIDLGISYRRLSARLREIGVSPASISGVFITHEHQDHIAGLPQFLKHHAVPVFLTQGTARALNAAAEPNPLFFPSPRYCRYKLGDVEVVVLPTHHDAEDPCAFQFLHRDGTILLMTDTGEGTPQLCQALGASDILIIESNHDEDLLKTGPYPPALKSRIASSRGHLSNRQTIDLVAGYATSRLRHLFLAHLSEHNNTPHLAETGMMDLLRLDPERFRFTPHMTFPGQLSRQVSLG